MIEIIKIERKRILNIRTFLVFLLIIALFAIYSTCSVLQSYNVPDTAGIAVKWSENLNHAKTNLQGQQIDRELLNLMRRHEGEFIYVDERNLVELVSTNYDGQSIRDLSDEDISSFYSRRLSNIREMLEESQRILYTEKEIQHFIQSAKQVTEIKLGYAEGWKVLNNDMGIFMALLLILISVLLLPLFGTDHKSDMKELYRGTKYGKKPLDHARILAALLIGVFLYVSGVFLFFIIKMAPFGLEGWNRHIQSNRDTFFSLYHITNLQQFLLNTMIGLVALVFVVSMVMFITAFMEKIMTSAVVYVFFWILLLLFDQMYLWPINHYFANFMPLRMTSFSHYYTDNEIYRIFGVSLSCMTWSIVLSGLLAGIMMFMAAVFIKIRRKNGMY